MASRAAMVQAFQQQLRNPPGPQMGGTPVRGTPFLPGIFTDTLLEVGFAFGANPADKTTWILEDVTADVMQGGGRVIHIEQGGKDQAPTPDSASCTFVLKNGAIAPGRPVKGPGAYTQDNPMSPNWPYLKENLPVVIRIYAPGQYLMLFTGYVKGFTPSFDETGNFAISTVEAYGDMRRLVQISTPIRSAVERSLVADTTVIDLWPCEDGNTSTQLANGFSAGLPATVSGTLTFASNDEIPGTQALPVGTDSTILFATAQPHTYSNQQWTVDWYVKLPAGPPAADALLLRILTSGGTIVSWDIIWNATGAMQLIGRNILGVTVLNVPGLGITNPITGVWTRIYFTIQGPGSPVAWTYFQITALTLDTGSSTHRFDSGVATTTAGNLTGWQINGLGGAGLTGVAFGMIAFRDALITFSGATSAAVLLVAQAYASETPRTRFLRIGLEEGIDVSIAGFYSSDVTMGPQQPDTLVNVFESCALADGGVKYDGGIGFIAGIFPGMLLQPISQRLDQAESFTLNFALGEIVMPFEPKADDVGRANRFKVDRLNGSSDIAEQFDGPLGINAIGPYPATLPTAVNLADDGQLPTRSHWELHKGTQTGLRYPTIVVLVHKLSAAQARRVLALRPGAAIRVIAPYQPMLSPEDIRLVVEGWSVDLTNLTCEYTLNCSRGATYDVHKIGDASLNRGRFEADGYTVRAAMSPGDITFQLVTPASAAVATDSATVAADFPVDINLDGLQMTVLSITGTTSPQTVTLSAGVPRAVLAGATVTGWQFGVLKL